MDLEDAVAPDSKKHARQSVCDALDNGDYGFRERWVRINALSSEWGECDLTTVIKHRPDALVLPKVDNADDVISANELLREANLHPEIALWAMIESPCALLNIAHIAAAASSTRLAGLIVGSNDLAKDLRLQASSERTGLLPALTQTVIAARAYQLEVLDGVYNNIADAEGFYHECRQGRQLGFDGKTLIHPSQIDTANSVFGPQADAINNAQAIVAAFAEPDNQGAGVLKINGEMTERLHLIEAQRLLAQYAALQARD
jgi:citrate lyase subunit beta/citryl-CoA lyase